MGKDLAADRIKLIYEYNKESSLFARVASIEIEQGRILDALNILNDGIAKHPNYASAYLMLGIANAYEGKEEEARANINIACDMIDSPATYDHYIKKVYEIITERNAINESRRTTFIEEQPHAEQEELFEDKLDVLAKELSKAKIIPKDDVTEIHTPKSHRLLSETLADIHFAQRNFDEAISMYEELINQKPEKADFYLQKIDEIKSNIEKPED